jgi:hypothetical protein
MSPFRLVGRVAVIWFGVASALLAAPPFAIQVVDESSGRGVPLVELKTVGGIRYVTDSAGLVAFDEPALMNRRVFFYVKSHGYELLKDGFGFQGKALDVTPAGSGEIAINRTNIAERLYRVTGGGIYRDSVLLQRPTPIREPLLNAGVLGSDGAVNAVFNGRIYWFWGDTNLPGHPLGIFHVPGATSQLPADGGLDPVAGVDLTYIADNNGQARGTCEMPGEGPTWIDGLSVLTDSNGRERMFAHYVKIKPPLETYARGLCEFDPATERFDLVKALDVDDWRHPAGHPVLIADAGVDYVVFARPYPYTRVKATVDAFCDPSQYEAYTCLVPGDSTDTPSVIRDSAGHPEYKWRRDGIPLEASRTAELIKRGALERTDVAFQLYDQKTNHPVQAHSGSLAWNEYRRQWIMIVEEFAGSSFLGEVWYAEAPTPTGPWHGAVKIVTHDNYSFYNPKQHPMFDREGGRYIFFEGTYATTFTNNLDPTPRYEYNQVMYRLDLADPRLGLSN